MGSLVKTPQSESTATLEVLDHLGVQQKHLKLIRSDPNYAESVAEFMKNQNTIESVLVSAYALNFLFVAKTLLELLRPKLSLEELKYIDYHGPDIVRQHYLHDVYTIPGGCEEGRAARRKAFALEEIAKEKLTDAGVSEERQKLLWELVFCVNTDYFSEFPPRVLENIRYHMEATFQNGKLTRLKDLATLLDAPGEIQNFLILLHKQAGELVAPEKS